MSEGNRSAGFPSARLIYISCFLAVVAVVTILTEVKRSYNEQRNYEGTAEKDATYQHCLKIPFIIDTCTEKYNAAIQKVRDDDDLRAQQEMADWASYTVIIGSIGVILSFGGLLFVYGTLQQTAQTAAISNRQLIADNRPWIQIAPLVGGKIDFREDGSCSISGEVKFKNVGHGPALKIRIFQDEFPFDVEDIVAETKWLVEEFTKSYKNGEQRGQTLFPGETNFQPVNLVVSAKVVEESLSRFPDGDVFYLSGCFIFAAIYESAVGGDDKFHTSVVQVVNQDFGDGMMRSVAVSRATPRKVVGDGRIYLQEYPATYQAT